MTMVSGSAMGSSAARVLRGPPVPGHARALSLPGGLEVSSFPSSHWPGWSPAGPRLGEGRACVNASRCPPLWLPPGCSLRLTLHPSHPSPRRASCWFVTCGVSGIVPQLPCIVLHGFRGSGIWEQLSGWFWLRGAHRLPQGDHQPSLQAGLGLEGGFPGGVLTRCEVVLAVCGGLGSRHVISLNVLVTRQLASLQVMTQEHLRGEATKSQAKGCGCREGGCGHRCSCHTWKGSSGCCARATSPLNRTVLL